MKCNHWVGVNVNRADAQFTELEKVHEHYMLPDSNTDCGQVSLFWLIAKSKVPRIAHYPTGFDYKHFIATRFKRCPDCGKIINWKKLKERIDKWLIENPGDHCKDYYAEETNIN